MKFVPLAVQGAFRIEPDRRSDERGWFARTWCAEAFAARGLESTFAQCSASYNAKRGTLRGMHWQREPHGETKLVRCTRGAVYDVLLDLRRESPSYLEWVGIDLDPSNGHSVYAPRGVAHGFLTLADDSEVFYQISAPQHAASAVGVRWNDPAFGIAWPAEVAVISGRDAGWPDWRA